MVRSSRPPQHPVALQAHGCPWHVPHLSQPCAIPNQARVRTTAPCNKSFRSSSPTWQSELTLRAVQHFSLTAQGNHTTGTKRTSLQQEHTLTTHLVIKKVQSTQRRKRTKSHPRCYLEHSEDLIWSSKWFCCPLLSPHPRVKYECYHYALSTRRHLQTQQLKQKEVWSITNTLLFLRRKPEHSSITSEET